MVIAQKIPGGTAARLSTYRLGSIHYLNGQYPAAIQEFQNYLNQYPESELGFDVTYNLAASEYQLGQFDKALSGLKRLSSQTIQSQGARRAELVYQLSAQAAMAANSPGDAVVFESSYLGNLPPDP